MIEIKQGSSEVLSVTFINKTDTPLPTGLSATLRIKTNPIIEKTSSITDMKALFTLAPTETNKPLTSYRATIKVFNDSGTYVKFIPLEILIKDPYDND